MQVQGILRWWVGVRNIVHLVNFRCPLVTVVPYHLFSAQDHLDLSRRCGPAIDVTPLLAPFLPAHVIPFVLRWHCLGVSFFLAVYVQKFNFTLQGC
jgi:hypothetical protein